MLTNWKLITKLNQEDKRQTSTKMDGDERAEGRGGGDVGAKISIPTKNENGKQHKTTPDTITTIGIIDTKYFHNFARRERF